MQCFHLKLYILYVLLFVYYGTSKGSRYKVIFERAELTKYNTTLGRNIMLKFWKINRTSFAINGSFDLMEDMNTDLMKATGQVFKFTSNEYRLYPVSMTVGVCKEFKRQFFMNWSEILPYTNVRGCGPMKKGHYYVRNYVPSFNMPNIPIMQGRYKVHGVLRQEDTFLFEGDGYGRIEHIMN